MHPSATSTGQELVLSSPLGEVELQGQVSNTLPLHLEYPWNEGTTSPADILQWESGAGPTPDW